MIGAYRQLNGLGLAHSVEVWDGETLVGGLYGVGIGKYIAVNRCFTGKVIRQNLL